MYALFCVFFFHRANWHSSATLTEVFPCFFLSCKANARIYLAKTEHGPQSPYFQLCCSMYSIVWFYVLFLIVLFYILFLSIWLFYIFFLVNVYRTTAAGCLPICS
jgi:hypothetical protein